MKKRYFVFLFILIAFAFIYLPVQTQSVQQSDLCGKYNPNSCPSPQCQLQATPSKPFCFWVICLPKLTSKNKVCVANPNSQVSDGGCSSSSGQNVLTDAKPTSSAEFYYEGVKTQGWKFSKIGNDVRIFYPVLSSITSSPPRTGSITPDLEASNGNCKFYSFSYERLQQTLTYDLPAQSTTPIVVNGKSVCKYSLTPLISGQSRISLLAGQLIKDLSQICPELQRGKPLSPSSGASLPAASPELSPQSCPSTEKCDVSIPKGSKQYFGFKVEDDKCGNKKITQDNNGRPIAQDIKQKAEQAVKDCKNIEEQPLMEFPSYCKKSKPPEIIFCKECLDYKNKFGKNKDDDFSCSKIINNKAVSEPDGKDCKLWQKGGADPGDWDDDQKNSAFGICKDGICVHDISALPPGKTCSCSCNGKQIGWNEYCDKTGEICAKKQKEISSLKNNICKLTSKLVCSNNQGHDREPKEAERQCKAQGKLFYTKVSVNYWKMDIKVECNCVNKPIECKPIKPSG